MFHPEKQNCFLRELRQRTGGSGADNPVCVGSVQAHTRQSAPRALSPLTLLQRWTGQKNREQANHRERGDVNADH